MIKDLLKLADNLDKNGFHKEADDLTNLMGEANPSQYKKLINRVRHPFLKNQITYKIEIDASSIDPNLLKGAVSFVPYGVSGILMKGNQIVNKNSNAVFPNTNPVSLKQGAEVTLPQNQNGILIPTSVSVSIIYSNGTRRNAVSTPESTLFTAGSNVVIAKINTFGKSAR